MKTIIVQGAMECEISFYKEKLEGNSEYNCTHKMINSFDFWEYAGKDHLIVIANTKMGMQNASIATMTAINNYAPDLIINQGTSGGHRSDLECGELIIGSSSVNINSLKMPKRGYDQGSDVFSWKPMHADVIECDEKILEMAENVLSAENNNSIRIGRIGSGDLYSREKDRIRWIEKEYNNLCEDMETYAVYAACQATGIKCISIRIISNNELNDIDFDEKYALDLQKKLYNFIVLATK